MKGRFPVTLVATLLLGGAVTAEPAGANKDVESQASRAVAPLTTGDDITCFFTNPGERQTLSFRAVSLADGKELAYTIHDYSGSPTGQGGTATIKGRAVAITECFPVGYYEVRFPELDLAFGVASLPPFVGATDPFYGIEGLISTHPHLRERIALMLRGGIGSNREWCDYQFNHWRCPRWDRCTYYDESNLFSVNVFNFSHEPVGIAPRLVLPEGMGVLEAPAQTAQSIAPRSEMKVTWKLDPAACPVARYDVRLLDPKHPVSGVSVPFLNPSGLRAESFDFMNVKRWRHIDPAKTELYKMIRVGMCPTAVQIDYWMRNLVVHYSK
jgi:hypothetical protein